LVVEAEEESLELTSCGLISRVVDVAEGLCFGLREAK